MRPYMFPMAVFSTVLLLAVLLLPHLSTAQPQPDDGRPDQVVLTVEQTGPLLNGVLPIPEREYVSPPTEAPRPFTHLLIRYEAPIPPGAGLILYVRASVDGAHWSDWGEVQENDDLWEESDGADVHWSETIDAGAVARFWQVRGVFSASPEGVLPELRRIEVNTVDTQAFAPAQTAAEEADAGMYSALAVVSKPRVVSRKAWGCPDGQGSRVTPAHYPVTHLIVHHSADSNSLYPSEPDWAARVRAFWSFHTHTRGWGDIGYNYVIDPNGVIYEGRAGGDDAVGFHDTANYGSMGVVVIGTYARTAPTSASQDSLVRLLAWKAGQKQIDPFGRSYYRGCATSKYCLPFNEGAVVPNIAGHREVTPGHTTCPGDSLMARLPDIRERVRQMMQGVGGPVVPDNSDLEIDELESGFARSDANWYDAPCGANGHTYYTYATDGAAENSATWRPNIPAAGTYRVYVHIPQGCGLGSPPYASTQAKYRIKFANGSAEQIVDHNTATEWVDIGAYRFEQGTDGAVELYDDTGEPLGAQRVLFFDAIKWVPEQSAPYTPTQGAHQHYLPITVKT